MVVEDRSQSIVMLIRGLAVELHEKPLVVVTKHRHVVMLRSSFLAYAAVRTGRLHTKAKREARLPLVGLLNTMPYRETCLCQNSRKTRLAELLIEKLILRGIDRR